MGWIHLNVWFFKVRSAYRIPILILNYERTSYVSRSSFVSQVRLAEGAPSPHRLYRRHEPQILAETAFATSSRCSSGKHIIPVGDIVPVRGYHLDAFTGSPWDEAPKSAFR